MAQNITESDVSKAIVALRAKGMSDQQISEVLGAMAYGEPPMSKSVCVTLTQFEPDVIGSYEDASQRNQDIYAASPMAQRQMNAGMQGAPAYYAGTADLNIAPVPTTNPNVRVEEPRYTSVDSSGNIVIY